MSKYYHEIRDPIHVFIRLTTPERKVVDSQAFQRLRHIHQLGMSHFIYPGANHHRFEHALGVMELATKVYDIVTDEKHNKYFKEIFPFVSHDLKDYWRKVLRMAALCHDMGHLPFSHSAEQDLLPEGWDHEKITIEIILKDEELKKIWSEQKIEPEDIAKISVGPEKWAKFFQGKTLTLWETILSEIITGDAFGVDRMDYLLRDSYHAGVAYGKFDHYRLIDNIRILPKSEDSFEEPALGIDIGGIHSAEALLLARYFMFMQVYFHDVRIIYDIHLGEFLKQWLPSGCFPINLTEYLKLTDHEVTSAMMEAARNTKMASHEPARRIFKRDHFRLLYQSNQEYRKEHPGYFAKLYQAAVQEFGEEKIKYKSQPGKPQGTEFPVQDHEGKIKNSISISQVLDTIPMASVDFLYVDGNILGEAGKWRNDWLDVLKSKN